MRRVVLVGIGVAVLAVAAGISILMAEDLLFDDKPGYSATWTECTADGVCVAVSIPCGWTAVNRRYKEDAQAFYDYEATLIEIDCGSEQVSSEPPPTYCRAGLCAIE